MSNQTEPAVGQVWADNDPRSRGRLVHIVALDETHATVEVVQSPAGVRPQLGRRSRVRLDRFRPIRTGYRPATADEAAPLGLDEEHLLSCWEAEEDGCICDELEARRADR